MASSRLISPFDAFCDCRRPIPANAGVSLARGRARWCTGGWRAAGPRHSDLITRYRAFMRFIGRRIDQKAARRRLVNFLLAHRTGDTRLLE
jgi:hypothetical protein